MTKISPELVKQIIRELLTDGGNHRRLIFDEINREFLQYALSFLDQARQAKLHWEESTAGSADDWYFQEMVANARSTNDIGIIGGVPKKTVVNIYGSGRRENMLEAAAANIHNLKQTLEELNALRSPAVDASITLDNGFQFTPVESMLILNSLAVKRQQISGGNWSAVGHAVEVPLMQTLCRLYSIPEYQYRAGMEQDGKFQVDFNLFKEGVEYRCEVKLNGRGNPESVTAAIARDPRIILADHISQQNRSKLQSNSIKWVDFSEAGGYTRFGEALQAFNFNPQPPAFSRLDHILEEVTA